MIYNNIKVKNYLVFDLFLRLIYLGIWAAACREISPPSKIKVGIKLRVRVRARVRVTLRVRVRVRVRLRVG